MCRANSRTAGQEEDTSTRASISRIVMLAEALFEVTFSSLFIMGKRFFFLRFFLGGAAGGGWGGLWGWGGVLNAFLLLITILLDFFFFDILKFLYLF